MITIPVFTCPACGGDVILDVHSHFYTWQCVECGRAWGIEVKEPVFKLG